MMKKPTRAPKPPVGKNPGPMPPSAPKPPAKGGGVGGSMSGSNRPGKPSMGKVPGTPKPGGRPSAGAKPMPGPRKAR